MSDEIFFDGKRYISANDAGTSSDLTRDYVARLCRDGKISGRRVGKHWYVEQESLKNFLVTQEYAKTLRSESLATERARQYQEATGNQFIEKTPSVQSPSALMSSVAPVVAAPVAAQISRVISSRADEIKNKMAAAVAGQTRQGFGHAKHFLNTPGGLAHAALSGAHVPALSLSNVPAYVLSPIMEFFHKVVALALAFMLTFGTYAAVDPSYARFAADSVRENVDAALDSYHAATGGGLTEFANRTQTQVAAVAENPASAMLAVRGALLLGVPRVAAHVARVFNERVDAFIFAVAFPTAVVLSQSFVGSREQGSVAVEITSGSSESEVVVSQSAGSVQSSAGVQTQPASGTNSSAPERIVEVTRLLSVGGISPELLDRKLLELENKLSSRALVSSAANTTNITNIYSSAAAVGRIEHLDGLDLTNPTLNGGNISGSHISSARSLSVSGTSTLGVLSAGETTLATTTVTGDLTLGGSLLFSGSSSTISATGATFTNATSTNATTTNLTVFTAPVAPYFTATSTFASTFPYASSTALTATNLFSTNFLTLGSTTLQNFTGLNATTSNATSTTFFATTLQSTNATSTNLFATTASSTNLYSNVASIGALTGGTGAFSSTLAVTGASTFTGLSSFSNASTSLFSVFRNAYFGGTATTTIDSAGNIFAAGTVGIGASSVDASAVFQIDSTTKGFLPPRMTTAQKNAIGSAAAGLTVFDSSLNKLNVYNGSAWKNVGSTEIGGEVTSGTAGSVLFVGQGGVLGQDNANFAYSTSTSLLSLKSASSTQLSIFQKAYFGGTATSTFDSSGSLQVGTKLGVGTAATAFGAEVNNTGAGGHQLARFNNDQVGNTLGGYIALATGGTDRGYLGIGKPSGGSTTLFSNELVNSVLLRSEAALHLGSGSSAALTIDTSNRVGIGDTTPLSLFTVGSGDLFQVNSSGAIAAVTGITTSGGYTQSGSTANTFTGLSSFSNASTSLLSVFDTAYFGGTATSTFSSTGALNLVSALTYGGVTLSNAVTGTGNMVLSASPTFTGTITGAALNTSGVITSTAGTANVFPYASSTALTATNLFSTNFLTLGSTTLQNFTGLNATTTNATSTNFFATTASSTNLFSTNANFAGLTVNGVTTQTGLATFSIASTSLLSVFNKAYFGGTATTTIDSAGNILSGGNLTFGTDGAYDIGAIGANRPRRLYTQSDITGGGSITLTGAVNAGSSQWIGFTSRALLDSPSDGVFRLTNNAQTDFTRLQFGGTTSAFPSLARSAAGLSVIPADGSTNNTINFGVGTSSPYALLSILAASTTGQNSPTTLFAIASTTAGTATTTLFSVSNTGVASSTALVVSGTTNFGGALTYGGVTLSNAVTGTGNLVLSASPTLTGTLTAAAANFSSLLSSTNASTSLLSVFNKAYFGGTATTTIDSAGNIYAAGTVGIGTTTPFAQLQIASSSASATFKSQLTLTDTNGGTNAQHWNLTSAAGQFRIGTSSDSGYATSTLFSITSASTTLSKALYVSSAATSSFANGVNLTAGCFSINGACLGSGGSAAAGTTGNIQFYSAGSLAAASTFTWDNTKTFLGVGTSTPYAKLTVWGADTSESTQSFLVADSASTTVFSVSNGGIFNFGKKSTTTIVNNAPYAWTIATSSTGRPLFSIDTTTGSEVVNVGQSGTDVIIGSVGTAANLIFEENSTIRGQSSGRTLTFGANSDSLLFGISSLASCDRLYTTSAGVISCGTLDSAVMTDGGNTTYFTNTGELFAVGTSTSYARLTLWASSTLPYFQAVDTASSTQFIITNSGTVGIGTSTPFSQLQIASSSASATFKAQLTLTDTNGGTNAKHFSFTSVNGELRIASSSDAYATSTLFSITNASTTVSKALYSSSAATSSFANGINLTSGCWAMQGVCLGGGSSLTGTVGQFAYFSGTDTAVGTSTIFVSTASKVGIGTTTPFRKFSISDTVSTAQAVIAYDATRYAELRVDTSGDLNIGPSGGDTFLNNDNLWVCTGGSIGTNGCPAGAPTGQGNIIAENKIGIGTSTPAYKLTIETQDTTTNFFQIASSSAQGVFIVKADGRVGVGSSTPTTLLSVGGLLTVGANPTGAPATMGTATSTFNGDIKITGKLDVGTIDPVYTIDGVKYATYGHSTIGIHEETMQTIQLSEKGADGKYAYTIDFDSLKKGSDLWLFYQVTDMGKDWKGLVVALTPSFDGNVFYKKDVKNNLLVISGDAAGEVSMRLTAYRFDFTKWKNLRSDQDGDTTGSHIISSKPEPVVEGVNIAQPFTQ